MKRIAHPVSAALLALCGLLAACGPGGGNDAAADRAGVTAVVTASASDGRGAQSAEASSSSGEASRFSEKNDLYEFAYSWPAAADAIPALRQRLESERAELLTALKSDTAEAQRSAVEAGFPYRTYAYQKDWSVVTDLPRNLSLSAQIYTFTGGAHGMSVSDALVWDRETGSALEPMAMFRSPAALDAAVRDSFCKELDRQRAKKRGAPVTRSADSFNDCIAPAANSTVIVGSASNQAFDRVGFLVPPYNAGPYAEGSYEVTLPVTDALIAAVKPEYRAAFAIGH